MFWTKRGAKTGRAESESRGGAAAAVLSVDESGLARYLEDRATLWHYAWCLYVGPSPLAGEFCPADVIPDASVRTACSRFDALYAGHFGEHGAASLDQMRRCALARLATDAAANRSTSMGVPEVIEPYRGAVDDLAAYLGFLETSSRVTHETLAREHDEARVRRMLALQMGLEGGRMGELLRLFADDAASTLAANDVRTPLYELVNLMCRRDVVILMKVVGITVPAL